MSGPVKYAHHAVKKDARVKNITCLVWCPWNKICNNWDIWQRSRMYKVNLETLENQVGVTRLNLKPIMIWYDMMILPAQADVPICWTSLWNSVIWQRTLCSSVSHFIQLPFLSSSSSVSYLLLHPLPLLLIFYFIVFHFSLSSSIPPFSLCLLYSSSMSFFTVLSFLSDLFLIFLFIILFFGNPLHTHFLLWSSFSFSSSSSDLSSSISISVFFIVLISFSSSTFYFLIFLALFSLLYFTCHTLIFNSAL